MRLRLTFISLAIAAIGAIAPAAAMAHRAPALTKIAMWQTKGGALVVVADADYTGSAHHANGLADARSRAILTLTLSNGNHRVTETDTTLFGQHADHGQPVHFDFRIPAAEARELGSPRAVKVRATLGRETTTADGRRMAAARFGFVPGAGTFSLRLGSGMCVNPATNALERCPVGPAPPAAPFGFEQWISGASALMCAAFGGPGYGQPTWSNVMLTAVNDSPTVGGYLGGIAADGGFAIGSYTDFMVNGFAQVNTSGPTLAGAIPPSVLTGPVTSGTGTATLAVTPPVVGLPPIWTLTPLNPASVAGIC